MPSLDDIVATFLRELSVDRLRTPQPLSAPPVADVWARVENRVGKVDEEGRTMALNMMQQGHCVRRWNQEDGTYILQISDGGVAVLAEYDRTQGARKKERMEISRGRMTVYFALAMLVVAALTYYATFVLGR